MTAKAFTRILVLLLAAFAVLGAILLPGMGMGWDEVTRWQSGDLKVDYYAALLAGEDPPNLAGDAYPGLFDLPLALVHRLSGGDRMHQGHAFSLFFACLGLFATAWMGKTVFGPATGLLAALLLALLPNFFGHSLINPKDIPFLSAYTLGLAGLLSVSRKLLEAGRVRWPVIIGAGLLFGLAGSARIPGLVLLGLAGLAWASCLAVHFRQNGHEQAAANLLRGLAQFGACAGATALPVLLFFPKLHSGLFAGVAQVGTKLHGSAREIPLLFRGEFMPAGEAPSHYAHWMLLVTTPLPVLLLMGMGLVWLAGGRKGGTPAVDRRETGLRVLFIGLALFPWAYVLVTAPALHNGLRHMLWGVPPLMVLAAWGARQLGARLEAKYPLSRSGVRLALVLLAGHLAWQNARLHPYAYVFHNALAGNRATVVDRYEGEYWFTSTRQLLEQLPRLFPDAQPGRPVRVRVAGPYNSAYRFVPGGFILVDDFSQADLFVSNTTFRTDLLIDGPVLYELHKGGIPIGVIKRIPDNQP